ncbi:MAG: hypothetical protein JWN68_966, partial [Nocardioides sp.]|nr:hypothetical protein [Nocardioides sp.]
MTESSTARASYKKRYEEGDDGLRFQDLLYQGNFHGMDPIPDGIKGDRMIRERLKSGVM